ncbi:MAG TPA: GtrA family protein [Nitrososphaeraceae archaeon]|nr:GtrA family protein [Nitrososphaeraceae archaeon]
MLNLQDNNLSSNNQILGSPTLSIILPTQHDKPVYQSPADIMKIIPKGITFEIIVVHYAADTSKYPDTYLIAPDKVDKEHNEVDKFKDNVNYLKVRGSFISAILKGMQLSTGQFILVMDADFPYPRIVTSELIVELIKNPNSIIVASRYTKGASLQNLPLLRRLISKGARTIARHGLSISHVQDPLSRCFALPRQLVKNVEIDGKGNQLLLEILVKVRSNSKSGNPIVITEIPFQQKFVYKLKKLEFNQISEYLLAIWSLYCHSKNSKAQSERVIKEQEKHRSIPFLSKTARFLTVGASGLALNYVVSFLLSNVISNLWYIQAAGIGIVMSVHTNFVLNKIWTFEDRNFTLRHVIKQYLSFLTLCAFGAIIQLSLTYVFFERWHIHYAISLMLAVCIASMSNFLLNKKITFGEKIWE